MEKPIAVIGGSGAEGSGLALRFASAGLCVFIGSRNLDRAEAMAREITAKTGSEVKGYTNEQAVAAAAVVILTVPLAAQVATIKATRGHFRSGAILVDATVPLEIAIGGRLSRVVTLWDGSAAQQAARLAPRGVPVVAAFHCLGAEALRTLDRSVDCDALICGDSQDAKQTVSELAETIPGVRAIDAGPLENARFLENSAALLIALNLQHKVTHSGIRITGMPRENGPHT